MSKNELHIKQILGSAYEAIKNRDYKTGKELLEKVVKINPNIPEVINDLGLLNLNLENYDKAIELLEKAIQLKPDFSLALNNLGNALMKKKKFDEAIKNYKKAIDADIKNSHAYYNLATLYFKKNEIKNAEKYFNLAIQLSPKLISAYINLFELYDKSNQTENLKKVLNKAKDIFETDPLIDFFSGIYQFKKKNYYEVVRILDKVELNKNDRKRNSVKNEILAKSYDHIGSFNQAYEYFKKSNDTINDLAKEKFDKNIFINLVKKRMEFFKSFNFKNWGSLKISKKSDDPIFLVGFPRSGTTLLDTILRSHQSIEVLEERPIIDKFIKYLEKKINNDLSNLNKIDENLCEEMRNVYFNERNNFINFDKNKIYIDKMPLSIVHVGELVRIFPNSKFIFALRHPCDTVLSCFMQNFSLNNAMLNFTNLNDATYLYNLVMSLWSQYSKFFKSNLHTIKYEEVVNNFDKSIRELLEFLNLEWSDDVKDFYKTASKREIINTPSYNQVNMPLYKKSIGRWKNYEKNFLESKQILDKWIKEFRY